MRRRRRGDSPPWDLESGPGLDVEERMDGNAAAATPAHSFKDFC